jgi:integrase
VVERRRRARGEGSLYQLADGRWRGSVDLGWVAGKRNRKQITRRTKAEVGRELRKLFAAAEAGQLSSDRSPTVAAWMDTYLREVAPSRVRPTTLHSCHQFARLYINPALGRYRLNKLRPEHIAGFYGDLSTSLAPSSVRRIHAVLRRALTVAVRWGLLSINPATRVDPPSNVSAEVVPLNVDEARQFLSIAANDRLEARWLIGVTLGLRQGEVLGLGWQHVDLERKVLRVERALQRQPDGSLGLTRTKTERSRRVVPMPPSVVTALERQRDRQANERQLLGRDWQASDLVFTTALGTPIHPRNDYRSFQRLLDKAGLRRVRLHDLRHSAASLLLTQGVAPRVVMEILGHSQISVTLNTYSHVDPELNRDATDRIETLLWPTE